MWGETWSTVDIYFVQCNSHNVTNAFRTHERMSPASVLWVLVIQVFNRSFSRNLSNVWSGLVFVNPTLSCPGAFFLCDAYHVVYGKQKLKGIVSSRGAFVWRCWLDVTYKKKTKEHERWKKRVIVCLQSLLILFCVSLSLSPRVSLSSIETKWVNPPLPHPHFTTSFRQIRLPQQQKWNSDNSKLCIGAYCFLAQCSLSCALLCLIFKLCILNFKAIPTRWAFAHVRPYIKTKKMADFNCVLSFLV